MYNFSKPFVASLSERGQRGIRISYESFLAGELYFTSAREDSRRISGLLDSASRNIRVFTTLPSSMHLGYPPLEIKMPGECIVLCEDGYGSPI